MTDYLNNFDKRMQEHSIEELKEMLRHSDEYEPEALEIIRKEILRRGEVKSYVSSLSDEELVELVTSPKKDDPQLLIEEAKKEAAKRRDGIEALRIRNRIKEVNKTAFGKFRRVKLKPINRCGQYRGKGKLQATEEGLLISGRHVYSLGARWAIGLGIFFGFLIITIAATQGGAYCAPGFIPLYFLVEYGILKREDLLVPYSHIGLYVAVPNKKLIGIDFKGSSICTPVVMYTDQWKAIYEVLQGIVPDADSSLVKILSWSKTKAAWILPWVFLGWLILFLVIFSLLLRLLLFPLMGIESIQDIQNVIIRILTSIVVFLVPAIPSFFLTRRYFRKKRHPSAF